jgi:hypothetical protein
MTRPYDVAHGQVLEFEKHLFAAGLTAEQMDDLTRDKHLMHAWVDSLVVTQEAIANSGSRLIQDVFSRDLGLVLNLGTHGVKNLSDLVKWSADELGNLRGLGPKRMKLIQTALHARGLKLSTHRSNDPERVIARREGRIYRAFRRDQLDELPIGWFVDLNRSSFVARGGFESKIGYLRTQSAQELRSFYSPGVADEIHSWIKENVR